MNDLIITSKFYSLFNIGNKFENRLYQQLFYDGLNFTEMKIINDNIFYIERLLYDL